VKTLPLFHHFKAIYQFQKHIVLVKFVANAPLTKGIGHKTYYDEKFKLGTDNRSESTNLWV
jgi:hypothetical protein